MCGIAGVVHSDPNRRVEPDLPRRMADAIAHRGPDAAGYWTGPGVALAHRRLSIVDLAGGAQPMGNEDGSVQVVFNGEIYNHVELRRWLEGRGHRFANHCDTEVLVHLYEELGADLVSRLRGMFAFGLWDSRRRRLLLGRDRLGLKPLYFARDAGRIAFASEPKALLADPAMPRRVDPRALEDYLAFGMVVSPRSIFEGIEQLPAAHTLLIDGDLTAAQPRRYWAPSFEPHERSEADWTASIRAKLDEAVRSHLMADVPLGAFLSGGVDSGAIVGMMAKATDQPVHTFTIGFFEKDFSELPQARAVAAMHGTHHTEQVIAGDMAGLLDEVTAFFDEPLADTSTLPTYLVSRLAAQHVKVVLTGDGADEAFGGYPRYAHDAREDDWRRRLPGWLRRGLLGPAGRLWPQVDALPRQLRLGNALTNLSLDADAATANSLAYIRQPLRRRLLPPAIVARLRDHDPKRAMRDAFASAGTDDVLAGMTASDLRVLLPDDYLVKVDRASMAHGLEARPPFLDHELVELACRLPRGLKIRDGEGKYALKRAVADLIPAENRRLPKRGFNLPVNRWMRGPLRDRFADTVLSSNGPISSLIHRGTAAKMFQAHLAGRGRVGRYGQMLWSLLVLSQWADHYLKPAPAEGGPVSLPTPKIRVAFVVHVMQVAGAEVLIEEIIRRLGDRIEPTVICLDSLGTIGERLQKRGVPVIVLGRRTGRDFGVARRMARVLRDRRVQVVHAHQYTPFFYAALAKVRCRGGFKLIQTEHGRHYPDVVSPMRRAVNRLALDKVADAVNACCAFSAEALSTHDGFVGRRIEVIENGVELSRYRPDADRGAARRRLGLDPSRKVIACVARFHPVKDHAMLVRAFHRVAAVRDDVDLVLAGDGPLRDELEAQSADLSGRVKFLGVRSDVPELLPAADVFALTSVSEAASLTLMEAMACAVPSVVTDVGGNPEIIRDGIDGLLVPRGDDAACAAALLRLLNDPTLASSMGRSARQRAEERYSLTRTVERYAELYSRLAVASR